MTSVENNDPSVPQDTTGTVDDLTSPQSVRALNHLADLEKADSKGVFGTIPNMLARFSLIPAKGVGDATFWTRTNDYARIAITGGAYVDPKTGEIVQGRVPRGGMANLMLMWLIDQMRRNLENHADDPARVELGDNLNQFLRTLGVSVGGRQYVLAMQAMRDVASASIQFVDRSEQDRGGVLHTVDSMIRGDIAESFELWNMTGNELPGFAPHVIGSPFTLKLAGDPRRVPTRFDVHAHMVRSHLGQQAFNWLALEVWRLDVQQHEFHEFTWDHLFRNVTHDYTDPERFRNAWKRQLNQLLELFPGIRPYIDMSAIPENPSTGNRGQRVIRIRRGARPPIEPKSPRAISS